MHRFLIEPGWRTGDEIRIFGDELKHLGQVLRIRIGDTIAVIDGSGAEYVAELLSADRQVAVARRISTTVPDVEPKIAITLLQGIPKSEKMDFIVQKAVELGVARIVPVRTEHVVNRDPGDMAGKVERWNRVAREAVKQCGRTRVPEVTEPMSLAAALKAHAGDLGIFLHEHERKKDLKALLKWYTMNRYHRLSILVGPEGGISPAEAEYLAMCGFEPVTLGNRILRTETASLAALAIIMHETASPADPEMAAHDADNA
jgi:16S rRNA (uracil1498-N3)-methyltransferase